MQTDISREKIRRHLEEIVGDRYPFSSRTKIEFAQDYIHHEFQSYGLATEENSFVFQGETFANVIANHSGEKNSVFILGALFDAVENSPGADDNASGIALLLEIARILSQEKFLNSLRFAAFNLEEFGMIGSSQHVRKIREEKQKIIGMISLEMVGYIDSTPGAQKLPEALRGRYPSSGDFIGLVSNGKSKKMLQAFYERMRELPNLPVQKLVVPFNGWLFPATRLSDHSPFWDAGYPALLVTDTSFFRNPHYHLPTDTIDTLNLDFMQRVAEGIVLAIRTYLSEEKIGIIRKP